MKTAVNLSLALPFLLSILNIAFLCTAQPIPPVVHTNFAIDLYNNNQIDTTTLANYWSVTGIADSGLPKTQFCSDNYILGGPGLINQNGYFERTYSSLPTHNMIYFFIRFYIIDDWKVPDLFMVQFDVGIPFTFNPVPAKPFYENNACGNTAVGDLKGFYVQGKVSHSSTQSVKLKIISNTHQASTLASFGFRDISLHFTASSETEGACVGLPGTLGVGNCACPAGSYASGSSCPTCPTECASCFGSSNTQCYSCKSGYSWDGTKCTACPSNCKTCSGTQCSHCNAGYLLKWDYTCILPSTCNPPYLTEGQGAFKVCKTPCQDNEHMYWDNTCRSACDFPLDIRTEGSGKFCDYKCATTEYLRWDGTCSTTCTYTPRNWMWRQFCDICPSGLAMHTDGSCVASCDPPFKTVSEGTGKKCERICPAGQFFLEGTTCLTACTTPLVPILVKGIDVCYVPCSNPTQEYLYWNGSCVATCPFFPRTVGAYKFCDPCAVGSFLYQNNTCQSTCDSPLTAFVKGGFSECYYPCGRAYELYNPDDYASCSDLYTYPYIMTDTGACILDLSASQDTQTRSIASVLSKFEILLSGIILASIFIIPNDARPLCLLLMIKMLEYLKFIKAKYPAKLQQVFNLLEYDQILSSLAPALSSESQQAFDKQKFPDQFEQYGLHSSFLVNSWEPIISIIVIIVIMIIVCSTEFCLKDFKFVRWILSHIKPRLNWATVLVFIILTGYFNVFIIYSSIEFRTIHFNSFLAVFSFLITIAIVILVLFLIVKLFIGFKEARKAVTQVKDSRSTTPNPAPHENEKVKNYLIFLNICSDKNYAKHAFVFVCLIRVIMFGIIVGFLFDHPFVQAFFIIIFSLIMIFYLLFQKPLKEWSHTVQFIIMEVTVLFANISTFVLSIINATCTYSFTFRGILGDLIIACQFILIIFGAGFLISSIVYQLFGERIEEYLKEWREKRDLRQKSTRLPDIVQPVQPKPAAVWSTTTPKFDSNIKKKGRLNHMDSATMLHIENADSKRKREADIELSQRNESSAKLFSQDSRVMGRHDISYNFTGNDDSRVVKQNFDVRDLETIAQGSQPSLANFDVYTDGGDNRKQRRHKK